VSIGFTFQKLFFDRASVITATTAATRRVLSKFGAFVRTRAKSSIRRRKRISEPGQPPSSHAGTLKRLIFFGYEASKQSVVIGPAFSGGDAAMTSRITKSTRRKSGTNIDVIGTRRIRYVVPFVLEYGGTVTAGGGKRQYRYRARPFMRPALEAEKGQLPKLWKDSVRKT
jgi:hypothetical protein